MRHTIALAALILAGCTADDTPSATTIDEVEQELLGLNCDRYEEYPHMAEAFWDVYDEAEQAEQLTRLEEACPGITATLEAAKP